MNNQHTFPLQKHTVDLLTGEKTTETVSALILPAAPDVCQECGAKHPPGHPHNAQSLRYQYTFYGRHGRWPDWEDAMAHCSGNIRAFWRAELIRHGVIPAPGIDKNGRR